MTQKHIGRKRFLRKLKSLTRNQQFIIAIELAYQLAKAAHKGQFRDDGERYFEHVKAVAWIIMTELNIKDKKILTMAIIIALLHDLIEDTFVAKEKHLHFIFDQISPRITVVIGILTKGKGKKKWDKLLKSRRQLVKLVKGADRLHNQRNLQNCRIEKVIKKNQETKEIIQPWLEKSAADCNIALLVQKIKKATDDNDKFLKNLTKQIRKK